MIEKIIRGKEWKTKRDKYSYDEVKSSLLSEGYELLEDNYINSKSKLTVRCPKGHERMIRFDNWVAGHRCSSCRNQREITPKWSYAKKDMVKRGYTVKGAPDKSSSKVILECSKGHLFEISIYNWIKGGRCKKCSKLERYMSMINLYKGNKGVSK